MTVPSSEPDYVNQHRMVALQAVVALGHRFEDGLFTSLKEICESAEVLRHYLDDGTMPK